MISEREELNNLKDEYQALVDIIEEDSFKEFRKYIDKMEKDINNDFCTNYHTLDDKRKKLVDHQAIFISKWKNIMTGIPSTVEQCKVQLQMLDEEEATNE